ncbi:alpha/beta fold hydrolase [Pseudomonas fluorescens]|jgi:long-chain acyl-CoA synthetase|uniref:alpha/beta fold hydrolase n=1 Tax=Pseudomonas fluorescens TaxID=294 RepID=UPI001F5C9DA7|nr:alpha/beta fold hydrolase [Pseudomonas fluorescens]
MNYKNSSTTPDSADIRNLPLACDVVHRWASATPFAPALSDASRSLDYRQLAQAVEEMARLLSSQGVVPGDRVLIVAENNIAAVVALFATQSLNAWPAVVNARLPSAEMDGMKALIEPRISLYAVADSDACEAQASKARAVPVEGLLAGPVALSASDAPVSCEPPAHAADLNVGLLIFTSGTTGKPKAVMHSHSGLLSLGSILSRSRRVNATDCYNGVAPLAHIMGVANLMSVMVAGASLRLMARLALPELAAGIADGSISHLSFVPIVYARLLDYIAAQGLDVSGHQLRYISCGGAPLDATLQRRVQSLFGVPLVNGYGMTECAPGARTAADRVSEPGTIGFAEEGVEIRFVDASGADVSDGTIGELWMRAPATMLGYYRNPTETAATLRPGGWIATGDLGKRLPDGALAIAGRQKEMIIRSGFNVYPAEVEAALNSLPAIAASGVVGRALADGDEEIVAFVEPRPGHGVDASSIDDALRELIAPYKRPGRIVFLEQLPQGSTGKIWKARLASMAAQLDDAPQENSPSPAPQYREAQPWLLRAVSAPTHSHFLQCSETRLHYRSWNASETEKPVLLFAHGYRANSHWWDFIAPYFVDRFRVFAMDFSGMGESGARPSYSAQAFSDDLIAVLEDGLGPATVVGHSYGGLRTLSVCADRPDLVRQAIILDSRVRFLDEPKSAFPLPPASSGRARHYSDYATIRERYRVIPAQPLPIADTFEHVAFHSIAHSPEGWHWRLDPALPFTLNEADGDTLLGRIDIPVDFVYGEESIVVEQWRAQRIAKGLRHCRGAIGIPNSHHHLMLDQPLALVAVIRALLAPTKQQPIDSN